MVNPITPLAPGASDFFEWDFNTLWCAANGDTLVGTPTFSSEPDGLVFGAPSVSGNVVTCKVTAPLTPAICTYKAVCSAATEAGRTPIKEFSLPVWL